jgi:cholesterol transport system auxiliary component
MTSSIRIILGLSVALLAACAAPSPPADSFHRLVVAMPSQRFAAPILPGTLEVGRLEAEGTLSERPLAYQTPDGSLARYRYDLWSDVPAVMVQETLLEALRVTGAAATVVTPDLRVPPDWTLRGRITRFELIPGTGNVAVRLRLAVVSATDGTLILQDTYEAEEASDPGPNAEAAALGRATSAILARLVADLGRATVPARR